MNQPIRRLTALLVASLFAVVACTSAATLTPASPSAAGGGAGPAGVTIATGTSAFLGVYLTGADGKTLYILTKDGPNQSTCTGGCAQNWPPLTVGAGGAPMAGPDATGTFATFPRPDGTNQVTHDGMPLYYFAGDAKAGDTNGQGTGGVWFVATPAGGGPAGASPASGAATPAGTTAPSGSVTAPAATPASSASDYNY